MVISPESSSGGAGGAMSLSSGTSTSSTGGASSVQGGYSLGGIGVAVSVSSISGSTPGSAVSATRGI